MQFFNDGGNKAVQTCLALCGKSNSPLNPITGCPTQQLQSIVCDNWLTDYCICSNWLTIEPGRSLGNIKICSMMSIKAL